MGLTAQTAARLIKKWGTAGQVLVMAEMVSDGAGGRLPGPITEHDCTLFEATLEVDENLITGAMRGENKQRFVVSLDGLTITPNTNDFLKVHGETYSIDRTEYLRVKGVPVFHVLEVTAYGT